MHSVDAPEQVAARRNRRGFTLVELLITILLVAIILMAIFAFFRDTSQLYATYDQRIEAQSGLRFALDQVTLDARRAGYLSSPDPDNDPFVCPKVTTSSPINPVGPGIAVNQGASPATYSADNPNIVPDRLEIIGSLSTRHSFRATAIENMTSSDTQSVTIRFFRSGPPAVNRFAERAGTTTVYTPGTGWEKLALGTTQTENLFLSIFEPNRYGTAIGSDGKLMYFGITAADESDYSITVVNLVQKEGNQFCGVEGEVGNNYEISVLNRVQYEIRTDYDGDSTDDGPHTLYRVELGHDGSEISTIPILTNVVDFQVWLDGSVAPEFTPPQYGVDGALGDYDTSATLGRPGAARILHVEISVSTQGEDFTVQHIPRATVNDELVNFDLDGEPEGTAAVITTRSSVELPNFTIRNM